jgi:hypothetical protein
VMAALQFALVGAVIGIRRAKSGTR